MNDSQAAYVVRKGAPRRGLTEQHKIVILRAADDINQRGGRAMLVQVLKGTKEPRLRKLGLESCPVFGIYESLDTEQIQSLVNLTIESGYLQLDTSRQGERVSLTSAGKEIERSTLAAELLAEFDQLLEDDAPIDFSEFSDIDMEAQLRLLEMIAASGSQHYLGLLAAWEPYAPRKLRRRIESVQRGILGLEG